jgi:hypothetical protein
MTVRRAIFGFLIVISILALPAQMVIDPSADNIASACIVLISSLAVILYLGWSSALETHPLSSMAIFGFCISSQLGALLVQTVAWTALEKSLYDPLYTFGTLALYQGIAIAVHVVYRLFSARRPTDMHLLRGVLNWAGIYRTPSCGALWFMGCLALPTLFFAQSQTLAQNQGGVLRQIANGFSFLVWAPFLIPFYMRELGAAYANAKLNRLLLIGYSAVIALLGLALNARGIMLAGMATVGLIYLLAGMRSEAPVTGRALRQIGLLVVVLGIISVPVSDLATSMVIARHSRGKVSASVMIRTTLHIWRQPALIAAYRADQEVASRLSAYDEHYITNPVLTRLVETKFYDNAFHFARLLKSDKAKARLRDISEQFVWGILPRPILSRLGIGVDKDSLEFSMGDYLAYLSRGVPLGGRKTGDMFAQGIALFGPLFPFIYVLICFALFGFMDLLTIRPLAGPASISALGMLQIWGFFMSGITYESLHKVLQFFIRGFLQIVSIYVLVFGIARLVAWMMAPRNQSLAAAAVPTTAAWPRSL